jgi:hypothetical protein
MPELEQPDEVEDVTDRLSDLLDDANPREAVRARVRRHFAGFQHAAVRDYVPLFVERGVRAELHH